MASTNESVFHEGMCALISTHILTPIVSHLTGKGLQVTVDELANVLRMTSVTPAHSMSNFMPTTGMTLSAAVPPAITSVNGMALQQPKKQSRGRSKTADSSTPVPDHERCEYIITRGDNRGKQCPNRKVTQEHCASCKDKKTAQKQKQISSGMTGGHTLSQPIQGSGVLNNFNPNIIGAMNAPTALPSQVTLNVKLIGDGIYHEIRNNLALRAGKTPKDYICIGIFDPKTEQISPLTEEKIAYCKQNNISYIDPNKQSTPSLPAPSASYQPSFGSFTMPATNSAFNASMLPHIPSITDIQSADEPDEDEDDDV